MYKEIPLILPTLIQAYFPFTSIVYEQVFHQLLLPTYYYYYIIGTSHIGDESH